MLFWQQDLWDTFVLTHNEYACTSFDFLASPIVSCPVHGCFFQPDRVPICYGLIRFTSGYWETRNTYFPYANTLILGGCEVDEQSEDDVMYCPECRRAEQIWEQERIAAEGQETPPE